MNCFITFDKSEFENVQKYLSERRYFWLSIHDKIIRNIYNSYNNKELVAVYNNFSRGDEILTGRDRNTKIICMDSLNVPNVENFEIFNFKTILRNEKLKKLL